VLGFEVERDGLQLGEGLQSVWPPLTVQSRKSIAQEGNLSGSVVAAFENGALGV
jgi:hypothetical protein